MAVWMSYFPDSRLSNLGGDKDTVWDCGKSQDVTMWLVSHLPAQAPARGLSRDNVHYGRTPEGSVSWSH